MARIPPCRRCEKHACDCFRREPLPDDDPLAFLPVLLPLLYLVALLAFLVWGLLF